jgi:hypothetical protein
VIQRLDLFLAADFKPSKPLRRSAFGTIRPHKLPEGLNQS